MEASVFDYLFLVGALFFSCRLGLIGIFLVQPPILLVALPILVLLVSPFLSERIYLMHRLA